MKTEIVTTQATSKRWKALMLSGAILLVGGVLDSYATWRDLQGDWLLAHHLADQLGWPLPGGLMIIVGVAAYLGGRIGAWWNHA